MKHSTSIVVNDEVGCIITNVNAEQYANPLAPIDVTEFGIVIDVNAEHV